MAKDSSDLSKSKAEVTDETVFSDPTKSTIGSKKDTKGKKPSKQETETGEPSSKQKRKKITDGLPSIKNSKKASRK